MPKEGDMDTTIQEKIETKITNLYERNQYKEVSSEKLKEVLSEFCNNQPSTFWGHVLSVLIAHKIIKKNINRTEKVKGKNCFFYGPGVAILKNNINSNTASIILDQFGNKYEYPSEDLIDETIRELVNKNTKLEITVYKAIKTIKAEVKLITKEI